MNRVRAFLPILALAVTIAVTGCAKKVPPSRAGSASAAACRCTPTAAAATAATGASCRRRARSPAR